jgi:hypothetical protein
VGRHTTSDLGLYRLRKGPFFLSRSEPQGFLSSWCLCFCPRLFFQLFIPRFFEAFRLPSQGPPRSCTLWLCFLVPNLVAHLVGSASAGPSPLPVRLWCEVKSRRGAPKRVNTEGFACPNQQCPYFGITDAHIHASFRRWQAWPSRAHPDLSLSGVPHDFHCPAPHPHGPSENPFPSRRNGADGTRLVD